MEDALLDIEAVMIWLQREGLIPTETSPTPTPAPAPSPTTPAPTTPAPTPRTPSPQAAASHTPIAERLAGGYSNVMFRLHIDEHRWVLRRPAKVAIERANDGMRREFRVLTALEGSNAPHPKPVALCEDEAVLGCVFYLMEEVDGIVPHGPALSTFTADNAARANLAFALVDALAELHKVDWQAVGLSDFGKPEGFHERQVSRWSKQLASYGGREIPGMSEAGSWLEAHLPKVWSPTIMHADYHMFNVLIAPSPPARVVAIVDWETASIGDPFLDFIGFCEAWKSMRAEGGWPSYQEMMKRYLQTRNAGSHRNFDNDRNTGSNETDGNDSDNTSDSNASNHRNASNPTPTQEPSATDQQYYAVLYNFRLAVLLEGIYQRSLKDPTRKDQHGIGERAIFNANRCTTLITNPNSLFN